jgi:exosome complex component RRP46
VIQVIHDDGSLLSAALNAATAALLDACIPMHSMFCAATVAVGADGSHLLDPDHGEELVRICSLRTSSQSSVMPCGIALPIVRFDSVE